jgi:hypothetical protein
VIGNHNGAFASYDLKSSIGPLSGTAVINPGDSFATTSGALVIDSVDGASFQATVGAVPEPSSLALCGLGAVTLAGYARRRSARA